MKKIFHSFRFATVGRPDAVLATALQVALIARKLHDSVSSITGSSCDAGGCIELA